MAQRWCSCGLGPQAIKNRLCHHRHSPDSCLWPSLMPHSHEIDSMKLLSRPPSISTHFSSFVFYAPTYCFLFILPALSHLSPLLSGSPGFAFCGSDFTLRPRVQPHRCQDKQVGCFYLHGVPKCWWEQGADPNLILKADCQNSTTQTNVQGNVWRLFYFL